MTCHVERRFSLLAAAELAEPLAPAAPRRPSRVIYLEAAPVTVRAGADDAARLTSSLLDSPVARMPGWDGGPVRWRRLVRCVQRLFEPFDVVVTDHRPARDEYMAVLVGGLPRDAGLDEDDITGIAPFDGGPIPRAVVFGFAAAMDDDVEETCETIAHEVAHAYGLDHEYLCSDVMTYLDGCGAKRFVDQPAPCGEDRRARCADGTAVQDSYRRLLDVLGPRAAPSASPVRPRSRHRRRR